MKYFKFLEEIFENFNIFYITPLKKNVNIFEVFFLNFPKKDEIAFFSELQKNTENQKLHFSKNGQKKF